MIQFSLLAKLCEILDCSKRDTVAIR